VSRQRLPSWLRKESFRRAAFPQRLEATVEGAAITARVELVLFPKLARNGVFPRPASWQSGRIPGRFSEADRLVENGAKL
ncbi:MAG: hypothetical protein WAK29_10295, partial [Terriglobales bacterium]